MPGGALGRPLKMVCAAETAAPNGETDFRLVGRYVRNWVIGVGFEWSWRRHCEHINDEDVTRERTGPEAVRAFMLCGVGD